MMRTLGSKLPLKNFSINENEFIDDMIAKFTKITNGLASLGDATDNDQKVRKIIRALPPSWEIKSTALNKLNDREKIKIIRFIGNL